MRFGQKFHLRSNNKNGKPIAVILSDRQFRELEEFKEQILKFAIAEGLDDLVKKKIHNHDDVFNRLKAKIDGSV